MRCETGWVGGPGLPNCIGAVMAGGLGRRLGGAKARVELAGRPLISYPLAAIGTAGLRTLVVAKADSELPPLDVTLVTEPAEPRHPLAGIVAALEEADRLGAAAALVVACDMPFLPPALLAWLAALDEPLALPLLNGHPQPMAARYATNLLPALRRSLKPARIRSLTGIVMDLHPRLIDETKLARFGDPQRMLHNVNTVDDLRRTSKWLPARPAT